MAAKKPESKGQGSITGKTSPSAESRERAENAPSREDLQNTIEALQSQLNDVANLLDCSDIAAVLLDRALCIRQFTAPATQLFSLTASDVGRRIGEITARFSDPGLLGDAEESLRHRTPREREVQSEDGRWWFRRIVPCRKTDEAIGGMVLTFSEVTQIKAADMQALLERESRLAAILDTAADAILTIDRRGLVESVNAAAERMFGYTAEEIVGQNVRMIMPLPYSQEHDQYIANYLQTGVKKIIGIGREATARRKDGTLFPVELAVNEIDHLQMFTGILHDISERKRLEREIVEIALLEKQRLGADLHDECGQELTALGLLTSSLVESLKEHAPADVPVASKIGTGLKHVLQYLRDLARGLAMAEIDRDDLPVALEELTSRLGTISGVSCEFHGDRAISLADNLVATHLFHIAQEACTNALKHAQARKIQVHLEGSGAFVTLRIQDDGIGIAENAGEGLGLRIMRNRASVIGAKLTLEKGERAGTLVTCTLPKERRRGPDER